MLNFDAQRFFSIIAASYGKRLLEKPYDRLAQTEVFQKLKDQPQLAKQAIEAASYALTALLEQNTDDSSPFRRALNEILMDLGPELSKRMHNGDTGPIEINSEKYTTLVNKPEEKLFLRILLEELDLEKVKKLAAWMKSATSEEKSNILKYIKGLDAEKIVEVGQLSTQEASDLLVAFEEPRKIKNKSQGLNDFLKPFRERMIGYVSDEKKGNS